MGEGLGGAASHAPPPRVLPASPCSLHHSPKKDPGLGLFSPNRGRPSGSTVGPHGRARHTTPTRHARAWTGRAHSYWIAGPCVHCTAPPGVPPGVHLGVEVWHYAWLCCCLQLAAPIGLSPLTAALSLSPFSPASHPLVLSLSLPSLSLPHYQICTHTHICTQIYAYAYTQVCSHCAYM